jgi:hypothetical protein
MLERLPAATVGVLCSVGGSWGPVFEQALEARIVVAGVPRDESGDTGSRRVAGP